MSFRVELTAGAYADLDKSKPYRALFIVQDDVVKILCIRAPSEKPVNPEDIES